MMLYVIVQNLAKLPVIVTGWIVVPCLWPLRTRSIVEMPKWLLPWVNPEDWTGGYRNFPPEYNCVPNNIYPEPVGFWRFVQYHAFRNGGDGLRNYEWHLCRYDDSMRIIHHDDDGYTIRQGKYLSIGRRIGKRFLKFGWRMTPKDVHDGYQPDSIRWNYGASPAWSFRPLE